MNCKDVLERIDLYLDGELAASEREALSDHLTTCASCRLEVEETRELRDRAAALPRSLEPTRDLWPEIEARISDAKIVRGRFSQRTYPALKAAAAVLVLVGSVVAAFLIGRGQVVGPEARLDHRDRSGGTELASFSVRAVESDFAAARRELLAALEARRSQLSPETYDTVMHNLAIIDQAIAGIDAALAEHPESPRLTRQLAVAHRQQIDLLERAVRLPSEV